MKLRITLEGKTYDVDVEILDGQGGTPSEPRSTTQASKPAAAPAAPVAAPADAPAEPGENVLQSPIAGAVLQVNVKAGDTVELNQVLLVMEAMKMETNIASPVAGSVKAVHVNSGDAVRQGQLLVEFA